MLGLLFDGRVHVAQCRRVCSWVAVALHTPGGAVVRRVGMSRVWVSWGASGILHVGVLVLCGGRGSPAAARRSHVGKIGAHDRRAGDR